MTSITLPASSFSVSRSLYRWGVSAVPALGAGLYLAVASTHAKVVTWNVTQQYLLLGIFLLLSLFALERHIERGGRGSLVLAFALLVDTALAGALLLVAQVELLLSGIAIDPVRHQSVRGIERLLDGQGDDTFVFENGAVFNGTIGNCFTGDLKSFYLSIKRLMALPDETVGCQLGRSGTGLADGRDQGRGVLVAIDAHGREAGPRAAARWFPFPWSACPAT